MRQSYARLCPRRAFQIGHDVDAGGLKALRQLKAYVGRMRVLCRQLRGVPQNALCGKVPDALEQIPKNKDKPYSLIEAVSTASRKTRRESARKSAPKQPRHDRRRQLRWRSQIAGQSP
ncbi:hypothetical protein [Paracoccus aminovorans]|uniref:hypothetical protein n=1 Tax=Paracoccus aminovorans TaxID=34004 RepID=UPI0011145ED0|nr:hypothetical protein [Paracoccus aminovorans]